METEQAMNTKVIVSNKTEIVQALQLVEKVMAQEERKTYALLCETLLMHFLDSGLTEIGVTVRPGRIDLLAPGNEIGFAVPQNVDEETRMEMEIGLSILDHNKNRISLSYRKGVNRCRISSGSPHGEIELCEEIEAFYANAGERQRQKPASVLIYLIKCHKGLFAMSMFFKTVRHVGAMLLPVFASGIIDVVLNSRQFFCRDVYLNILGSVLALAANLLGFWAETLTYRRFTRAVESGFKLALVKKLQMLSFKYHLQAQSGHLLSKISDVQFVEMLIYDRLQDVLHLIIDVLIMLILALMRYPPMVLFYCALIPVSIGIMRSFSRPILERKTTMRRRTESSNAAFKEMLEMDQLTRSHGRQQDEFHRISHDVRRVQEAAKDFDTVNVAVNSVTYGGFQGFRLLCLCFAAFLFTRGHISMGTVVLFQSLFDMMINSVQKALDALPQITQGYDSLISISEILFEKDIELSGSYRFTKPFRGEIELSHISLAYDGQPEPVLRDVSMHVPAGKVAAIVGSSGAGKSSLLNLILGLYPPTSGEIRIDGVSLSDLDINDFRRHVAVVPQNTALFSGTLWDNLVFGLKYVSRSQVMEVIRSVGLEDLVWSLPDGLNSVINEGGSNLSGGQRQRVAIARALLRDARIVLFDEATSALDIASEQKVQKAIDAMMTRCTLIMVAHRLNTIKKADLIYRIEDGRAVRCQSYESLIGESGVLDGPPSLGTQSATREE